MTYLLQKKGLGMLAVFVNVATVLAGSFIGILCRNKLRRSLLDAMLKGIGLCTLVLGIISAVKSNDVLALIICMALGIVIGELLRIDDRIEGIGQTIKNKFFKKSTANDSFSEGFVTACIVFCIGSMTIIGSLEAGINHDYSLIFAKSALDFISSMTFGAAMGMGVPFAAIFVLVFQGTLTMLASLLAPVLEKAVVTEMSAVGGVILIGLALNLLDLPKNRIKIANMLPAVFLPIGYVPLANFIVEIPSLFNC